MIKGLSNNMDMIGEAIRPHNKRILLIIFSLDLLFREGYILTSQNFRS